MKQINEAAITLDIAGLESDNFDIVARMMQLAGEAETPSEPTAMAAVPAINPMMSNDAPSEDELSSTDFGLEIPSEPEETNFADDYSVDRMIDLSGVNEDISTKSELGNAFDNHVDLDLEESQLLPDLSLDADVQIEEDSSSTDLRGPFDSEEAAVIDAQHQTNGVEGNNFILIPQDGMFYWKRVVTEQMNEPEFSEFDTDGITKSRHEIEPKRNRIGDNGICEDEEIESEDESVDEIFESLNSRYQSYITSEGK